jgi:hypothetical protein
MSRVQVKVKLPSCSAWTHTGNKGVSLVTLGLRGTRNSVVSFPPSRLNHGIHWKWQCMGPKVSMDVSENCKPLHLSGSYPRFLWCPIHSLVNAGYRYNLFRRLNKSHSIKIYREWNRRSNFSTGSRWVDHLKGVDDLMLVKMAPSWTETEIGRTTHPFWMLWEVDKYLHLEVI